jgi:hypothetical protein
MRQLPVTKAFSHIVASTRNNLQFAFASQWPWLAVLGLMLLVMQATMGNMLGISNEQMEKALAADPALQTKFGLWIFAIVGVGLVGFASIAVSWHRYVLKDELPKGMARLRVDGVVWRYVGNLILIGLMISLVMIPVAVGAGLIASVAGKLAIPVLLVLISIVILPLIYRLSVKLPAIALERQDFRMGDAWRATDGNWWQIAGIGLLVTVLTWGVGLALVVVSGILQRLLPGDFGTYADIILQVGANWFLTVIGITTLTSLYGFFVEKRDF